MIDLPIRLTVEALPGVTRPGAEIRVRVRSELPDGVRLSGTLVLSGLAALRADQLESDLAIALHGRATLSIGPSEIAEILSSVRPGRALAGFAHRHGMDAEEIGHKAGVPASSVRRVLAGGRAYTSTRERFARLVRRVSNTPTVGEALRQHRIARGYKARDVAGALDVPVRDVEAWEADVAAVPADACRRLRGRFGLAGALPDAQPTGLVYETAA